MSSILHEQELNECIEMQEKRMEQTKEPYFHDMQEKTVAFLKEYKDIKQRDMENQINRRSRNSFFIAAMLIILLVQIGLLLFDLLNTEVPFSIMIAVLCLPNSLIAYALYNKKS